MLRPVLAAASVALVAAVHLETDYSVERTLAIECESSMKMETTTMEMERDGEPVDNSRFGGGSSSSQTRHLVVHDKVVAHEGTRPTKVKRAFQEVDGKFSFTAGDEEMTRENDSPLKGVTLEIEGAADGETTAKVVDGDAPPDASLKGHHLELALDALLPEKDVDAGASWTLEKDQVRRALGLDLDAAIFPPPEAEESEAPDEGGGGRRRGFRFGGGGGNLLGTAEWEGKATLTSESEEQDGVACHVIQIELEAKGELPDPPQGGGRRGGRVALEPEASAFESTYELKLSGKLYFAKSDKRPVLLDLEGTARTESNTERTFRDSTMKMHSVRQGELKHRVAVSTVK
jgi:hypothetical protein